MEKDMIGGLRKLFNLGIEAVVIEVIRVSCSRRRCLVKLGEKRLCLLLKQLALGLAL